MARIGNLTLPRRSNQCGRTRTNDDRMKDPFYIEAGQQSEMLLTRARELLGTDGMKAEGFYEDAGLVWRGLGEEHPIFFNEIGLQLIRIEQERYKTL